jgi:hypothetical protein
MSLKGITGNDDDDADDTHLEMLKQIVSYLW